MKTVLLAACLVSPAMAQVIAGGVLNRATGEPVPQVRLRLHGKTDVFAVTDAGGHFEFTGVQPDQYWLFAYRAGFLTEERAITLAAGEGLPDLRFPIVPQAAISGVAVDADGWPVRRATVLALRAGETGEGPEANAAGGGVTDDLGRFRVAKLPAGRYYIRVSAATLKIWDSRYVNATYPAPGAGANQPLAVSAGQELGGLTIRLSNPEGFTVQGHIALPPRPSSVRPFRPLPYLVSDGTGDQLPSSSFTPDGFFTFRHVLPGSYWVRFTQMLDDPNDWAYWTSAVAKLEVGNADLSGLELSSAPNDLHDLRGTVVFDDPSLRAPVGLALTWLDLPHPQTVNKLTTESDGSFVMTGTRRGRYRIDVAPVTLQGTRPLGVIARLGDGDLQGGEFAFDGSATPLQVQLVSSTASLSVQVTDAAGRGLWDAVVHVEPVNPALRVRAGGATDQNGNYQALLPPGEYRVWAGAEGSGAVPARTVLLAAGANPPLRFALAGRAAF